MAITAGDGQPGSLLLVDVAIAAHALAVIGDESGHERSGRGQYSQITSETTGDWPPLQVLSALVQLLIKKMPYVARRSCIHLTMVPSRFTDWLSMAISLVIV